MNDKYTITLDGSTQKVARMLARARFKTAREAGVVNAKKGPQSNELTDLEGIGGEFAFCAIMNLWPDLSVGARKGGYDCVTHSGVTIDVKTTHYPTGQLLVGKNKFDTGTDVYVLIIGKFPQYKYVGWATAAEIINGKNLGDLGWGEAFLLPQSQLHGPGEDIDGFIDRTL